MSRIDWRQAAAVAIQASMVPDEEVWITPLIWGDAGVGKSSVARAVARAIGARLIQIGAPGSEPPDFNGTPVVREAGGEILIDEVAKWWAVEAIRAARQGEKIIILIDDVSATGNAATMAALQRVVLDRRMGSLALPPGVGLVMTANPADVVGGAFEFAAPLANRLLHIYATIDYTNPSPFIDWMIGGGSSFQPHVLPPGWVERIPEAKAMVAAFIRSNPSAIHIRPKEDQAFGPWPSPRTWHMTAMVLAAVWALELPDPQSGQLLSMLASGLVGPAAAGQFIHWLANQDLPGPEEILKNPGQIAGMRPDQAWAVLGAATAFVRARAGSSKARKAIDELMALYLAAADAGFADMAVAMAKTIPDMIRQASPGLLKELAPHLRKASLM